MDDDVIRDSRELLIGLRRLRLPLMRHVYEVLRPEGINLAQLTVMAVLEEAGETTMSNLARELGTTMGAATNLVDRLVRTGYAKRERGTEDRRIVKVRLTPKGHHMVEHRRQEGTRYIAEFFTRIPPEERRAYLDVQRRLAQYICERDAGESGSPDGQ